MVIVLGDLNAKVGSDTSAGRTAVGPSCIVGKMTQQADAYFIIFMLRLSS